MLRRSLVLEDMNRRVTEHVEVFREHQAPPPADQEAEILVCSADATGTPMRDRGGSMQMAYLGAAYTVARFVRTSDEIMTYLSDDWTEYHSARIAREQSLLHPKAHSS